MKVKLLQILFCFCLVWMMLTDAAGSPASTVQLDYQLYTNSLGDEYSRVNFPAHKNKTILKLNSNYSIGPLLETGDEWNEFDIRHLPRADVSIEKYFGKSDIHPFIALQTSAEVNVGEMEPQPLIQAKNLIAGVSLGPEDDFRTSFGVIKGTGFHSKESSTGLIGSAGVSKQNFGVATSFVIESISETSSPSKFSAGAYYGKNKSRFVIEYDKQFDKEYDPSEISFGVRHAREWNSRDVFLFSSYAFGTDSAPGSAPRFNIGITFNLQKNKDLNPEDEVEDDTEEEIETIDDEVVAVEDDNEEDDDIIIVTQIDTDPKTDTGDDTNTGKNNKAAGTSKQLKSKDRNTYRRNKPSETRVSETQPQIGEKNMPNPTTDQTNSYELQPASPITPESLGQLSESNPSDPTLTLLLALLAVVGGGAAWKFYTQYSEQKHDQKMKQMEIDAKMQGLQGAQPPPCQAANVKLETEIKEIKARLGKIDQKMSLNADFDGDLLTRKFKKLERRVKDLEGDEE